MTNNINRYTFGSPLYSDIQDIQDYKVTVYLTSIRMVLLGPLFSCLLVILLSSSPMFYHGNRIVQCLDPARGHSNININKNKIIKFSTEGVMPREFPYLLLPFDQMTVDSMKRFITSADGTCVGKVKGCLSWGLCMFIC